MGVISTRGITIGHGAPGALNAPPATYTAIGQIIGVGPPGVEAPAVAAHHLADLFKKKRAGRLADSPDITISVNYDPAEASVEGIKALITTPDTNNHFFKITFPGDGHTTPGNVVFQAHVTAFAVGEVANEEDENLTADITLAITDVPDWNAGA
jgi:hypothetical protein